MSASNRATVGPGLVIDGTGLTTTVPLTIKNGRSQSGVVVQVTGTVASGFVINDSGGVARGGIGYAVSNDDWITHTLAGDVVVLGDSAHFVRIGAPGAAYPAVHIDLANNRVGIGQTATAPSHAVHVIGDTTTTGRVEIEQLTASLQAMLELKQSSTVISVKSFGGSAGGTQLGASRNNSVTVIGTPTSSGVFMVGTDVAKAMLLGTSDIEQARFTPAVGLQMTAARFELAKGADVASAGTLTLGAAGNVFGITGTTAIDFLTTTNWQAGSIVWLRFAAAATVNHNTGSPPGSTAPILLSGAANITFAANTVLGLIYDGTNWIDVRKVA